MKNKYRIVFFMPDQKRYESYVEYNEKYTEDEIMIDFVNRRFIKTNNGYVNPSNFLIVEYVEFLGTK